MHFTCSWWSCFEVEVLGLFQNMLCLLRSKAWTVFKKQKSNNFGQTCGFHLTSLLKMLTVVYCEWFQRVFLGYLEILMRICLFLKSVPPPIGSLEEMQLWGLRHKIVFSYWLRLLNWRPRRNQWEGCPSHRLFSLLVRNRICQMLLYCLLSAYVVKIFSSLIFLSVFPLPTFLCFLGWVGLKPNLCI